MACLEHGVDVSVLDPRPHRGDDELCTVLGHVVMSRVKQRPRAPVGARHEGLSAVEGRPEGVLLALVVTRALKVIHRRPFSLVWSQA